jgi:hypothetical protein
MIKEDEDGGGDSTGGRGSSSSSRFFFLLLDLGDIFFCVCIFLPCRVQLSDLCRQSNEIKYNIMVKMSFVVLLCVFGWSVAVLVVGLAGRIHHRKIYLWRARPFRQKP